MSEDPTRPVSVAELLARNGTIGSPPVGGHRRRKRRNGVSVAELTGEIPIIRTGEIPVVVDDELAYSDDLEELDEASVEGTSETVVVYSSTELSDSYVRDTPADAVPDYSDYQDYTPGYDEPAAETASYLDTTKYDTASYEAASYEAASYEAASYELGSYEAASYDDEYLDSTADADSTSYDEALMVDPEPVSEVVAPEGISVAPAAEVVDQGISEETLSGVESVAERLAEPRVDAARPPLSSIPLPGRRRGPERSHDPRPRRRSTAPERARPPSSGAERMSPDPVDEAVDLAELVAEQAPSPAELRSYLKSSTGALFFGETVADDLARRGEAAEPGYDYGDHDDYDDTEGEYEPGDIADDGVEAPRRGALSVLGTSLVAVVQSLLAVVFGAGLFIGFDQLWRWNNIVALALSALVIAALMIGVHVVRKTEDFVSTLIAALVGILVTFGPLALQST